MSYIPKPPPRYCVITGKVSYDKKGALTAKNRRYSEDKIKLRVYQCQYGNHWHLTHKS